MDDGEMPVQVTLFLEAGGTLCTLEGTVVCVLHTGMLCEPVTEWESCGTLVA